MRARFVFALLISVALIGGATWFRLAHARQNFETLTISPTETLELYDSLSVDDIFKVNENPENKSQPLTQTDLISRQLFSDYIGLVNKGRATPENIGALAEKYADNIEDLEVSASVDPDLIPTVSDSRENFITYQTSLNFFFSKYEEEVEALPLGEEMDLDDSEFPSSMKSISEIYSRAADDLKKIPPPSSIKIAHIELINNYLGSAQAFRNLSNFSNDPLGGFSALLSLGENSANEDMIKEKIRSAIGDTNSL